MSRLDETKPLNSRQQRVRDFVHQHHREHGEIPSRRIIALGTGLPWSGHLSRIVDKLRDRGDLPRRRR